MGEEDLKKEIKRLQEHIYELYERIKELSENQPSTL